MPLPPGFWTGGWSDFLFPHEMLNPNVVTFDTGPDWIYNRVTSSSGMHLIQGHINEQSDPLSTPQSNLGYLLGRNTADPNVKLRIGIINPVENDYYVDPPLSGIPLMKVGNEAYRVDYQIHFVSHDGTPSSAIIDWRVRNNPPSGLITYTLHHVQPVAFVGYLSAVVGAILMYSDYLSTRIDQDSFDAAYDQEIGIGNSTANRPYVEVVPQQGESVTTTLKRVLQHSTHFLGYNLKGSLGLYPSDSPDVNNVIIGSGSNIKGLTSETDLDLLTNRCDAMHGAFSKTWGTGGTGAQPFFDAQWEPRLKSDYTGYYTDRYEDIESQNRYRVKELGTRIRGTGETATVRQIGGLLGINRNGGNLGFREIDIITEGEDISVFSLPLFYTKARKDVLMESFISNEVVPRVEGKLVQDFMGLDLDIGSIITMTDWDTMKSENYRVYRQEVDFNSLTITSYYVQFFQTRYTGGSTVVWDYVRDYLAPVGSTTILHNAGSTEVEARLFMPVGHDWLYRIHLSKDGGPWEEATAGWTLNTGSLVFTDSWTGLNNEVRFMIQCGDDNEAAEATLPTPLVTMPTATI